MGCLAPGGFGEKSALTVNLFTVSDAQDEHYDSLVFNFCK